MPVYGYFWRRMAMQMPPGVFDLSVPATGLELPLWLAGRPCFFVRYDEYEPRLDARDQTKVPITM